MGFISSASTISLDAHLTQKGRERMLLGLNQQIVKFTLGDSDTNYLIDYPLVPGTVPDVTGDHSDCIISVSEGVNIKSYVPFEETIVSALKVHFVKDSVRYNSLIVEVDLGNLAKYMLENSTTATYDITLTNPFLTLYEGITIDSLNDAGAILTTTTEEIYFEFPTQADGDIYNLIIGEGPLTYDSVNDFTFLSRDAKNLSPFLVKSPLQLTFSSNVFAGCGEGSVAIFGRDYGYLITDANKDANNFSFVKTDDFEGSDSVTIPKNGRVYPVARFASYTGLSFLPETHYWIPATTTTYTDVSGSHDHLKRFSGVDFFTSLYTLIDEEVDVLETWHSYAVQTGAGDTDSSGVRRIRLNMTAKPLGTSVNNSATAGSLTIILKMDANRNNWNSSGNFITII